ncbi:hypothetical protein PRK78_003948 [Emydomyces testavorans]|uniref:protein-histidine N-methyltransferase n=1 Tax=Emydomyces testavorans TaxID=2070801 RepID=A0AAF0II56_9EURO|nr:hypothetical protein PRK78_003948 [Emydomyces testavorans]
MSSAFTFGFNGDDIDIDRNEHEVDPNSVPQRPGESGNAAPSEAGAVLLEARKLDLEDMISSLPSQISYNTLSLYDPTEWVQPIPIPRRDVCDIRAQLMAEDNPEENSNERLIAGLETDDIIPALYEGGLKTWECSATLAETAARQYGSLLEKAAYDLEFIELGAGTAIPSLLLLHLLFQVPPDEATQRPRRKISFVLADYNATVLNLVTLPNILLTWYTCCKNPNGEPVSQLDINSVLLDSFRHDLCDRGISLSFISGSWSPRFVDLVAPESKVNDDNNTRQTCILASETIYSPRSIRPFAETLTALLRRRSGARTDDPQDKANATALVAAKTVYFGVGGGVAEFLETLRGIAGEDVPVRTINLTRYEGVERVVLEIRGNA